MEFFWMELPDMILAYVVAGITIGMAVYLFTADFGERSKKVKDIALARGIICGIFCPVVIALGAVALSIGAVVGVVFLAWKIPQGVWWTIKTAMKRID